MMGRDGILHLLSRSDLARSSYGALLNIPGLGAGVKKLVHRAIPPGTKLWIRIPKGLGKGFWMHVDPRFDIGYVNGDYEPWIQDLLKSELASGDCYYDVGAHAGFFSLIASRFVGSRGKIVVFEPDPENMASLKANMARNEIPQVTAVEAAVWSSPGEATFERALDASNRTQGHLAVEADSTHARIRVNAVRLDDLVFNNEYPAPQFIKMDVEGAEWEALHGASRLLSEIRPKLLCEVHDPAQMKQIQDYLCQFDYQAEEWAPVHEHYANYRQVYLWAVPSAERLSSAPGNRA
jgi:FkbM family methyltransferase